MVKEVNAEVTFQENCEYESSSANKIIYIEPQNVQIEVTITNKSESHNDNINYYDDILEVKGYVYQPQSNGGRKTIKTGRIEFYYQSDDSNTQKLINIDENSCILAKDGTAGVIYRPEKSGQFILKYIDDKGWYNTATASKIFKLNPIPIKISFIKKPPYITHLHDSIELQVKVEKKYPRDANDVLNYGVVTFLHYLEHFDMNQPNKRVERVIGNPAIVRDGIATIKYIPIQEYDDIEVTQLIDNIEYIRAVYNYDNDLYYQSENDTYNYETYYYEQELQTDKWQYYSSANVYTNIAIYKPNSVVLGIKNKSLDNDKIYHYSEDDSITIQASLYDDDGNMIVLKADDPKTLTFHVIGTYTTFNNNLIENYDEDNFTYHSYELDTDFDDYIIETVNNQTIGYFQKTLPKLKPGEYTVQASTNGQIINGVVKIYRDNTPVEVIEDGEHIKNDTVSIRTDKYLDNIDISNVLYIESEYKPININSNITMSNNTVQTHSNITIEGTLNIDNQYKDMLNGKKCYFFDVKNDTKYEGVINKVNNVLKLRMVDNISFNIANDYPLYAYIPAGYYTDNTNYIFIDNNKSNTIIVQARDTISLKLTHSYQSNTVYGNVKYTLSCPNMFLNNATVDLTIEKGNSTIQSATYYFTQKNTEFHGNFSSLVSGAYTIYGNIRDTNNRIELATINIEKDSITQSLQDSSKIINANPNGTVELNVSSVNNNNLNLLNLSKLKAYIQNANKTYNISLAQQINYTVKERTQSNIKLLIPSTTYLPAEWNVGVTYEGDDNFIEVISTPSKFKTVLVEPKITIEHNRIDSLTLILDNNINNVSVIGRVKFLQNNTELSENIFITDKQGACTINDIPSTCNNIQFIIDPYDEEIIDIIESDSFAQLLKYEYNVYEMRNDSIYEISNQYIASNKVCLFAIYDAIDTTITRNII